MDDCVLNATQFGSPRISSQQNETGENGSSCVPPRTSQQRLYKRNHNPAAHNVRQHTSTQSNSRLRRGVVTDAAHGAGTESVAFDGGQLPPGCY